MLISASSRSTRGMNNDAEEELDDIRAFVVKNGRRGLRGVEEIVDVDVEGELSRGADCSCGRVAGAGDGDEGANELNDVLGDE